MWLFYYFNFEKNYDILKSKSPCILLNKSRNFNKNATESKMGDPTQNCVKFLRKSMKDSYNNLNVKRITGNTKFWQIIKPNFTD